MEEFLKVSPTGLPLNQDLFDSYKNAKIDAQSLREKKEVRKIVHTIGRIKSEEHHVLFWYDDWEELN